MAVPVWTTLFGLLVVLSCLDTVQPHPQCLDSRPPFEMPSTNNFCSQYSEYGCCATRELERIRQRWSHARDHLTEIWDTCGHYVEELLCQICSPYAAHVFDAESIRRPKKFPGLCQNYCEEFYDTCRDVVQYIDEELANSDAFGSRDAFCEAAAIPQDIDYCYPELLTNPLFSNQTTNVQRSNEDCLCLDEVLTDLRNPIVARHAGDGSGRLFVGEQFGIVYIFFPHNRTGLYTPFLNISDRVLSSSHRGDERGFFSIAFHPNFAENRRFFVYYSTTMTNLDRNRSPYSDEVPLDHKIRISEMKAFPDDNNQADPNTERVILEVIEPYWNHNGGELMFGDDNYLYMFVGDGGKANDPFGMAQNMSVHLGKILRVDVDTHYPEQAYSIPPDNPFVGVEGVQPEIYAYGVRNIWRCGKDRGDRETGEGRGRIMCGDVGQSAWEELDIVKKGANYGWNDREGFECFRQTECGRTGPQELPVYAYPHSEGKSVTGGVFYRGCESPNLNGLYLYGDYFNGRMFSLKQNGTEWHNKEVFMCGPDICQSNSGLTGEYGRYIISFGEDQEGEIYLLSSSIESAGVPAGKVFKIIEPRRRGNPESCQHANGEGRYHLGDLQTPSSPTPTGESTTRRPSQSTQEVRAGSRAPSILSTHIRTCSMAVTIMCVLRSIQH